MNFLQSASIFVPVLGGGRMCAAVLSGSFKSKKAEKRKEIFMGKIDLSSEDREWLEGVYQKLLVKMKAECERIGTKIPYSPKDGKYSDMAEAYPRLSPIIVRQGIRRPDAEVFMPQIFLRADLIL